jgi:hypothetical protein
MSAALKQRCLDLLETRGELAVRDIWRTLRGNRRPGTLIDAVLDLFRSPSLVAVRKAMRALEREGEVKSRAKPSAPGRSGKPQRFYWKSR